MRRSGADRLSRSLGERFASRRVVENYRFRPPYSPEVFETLRGLIRDAPKTILDAGCGPGKIALGLVNHADHVDAVDPSTAMLSVARSQSGANDSKLRWICSTIEDAPLKVPYALIVAGASFHWMDPRRRSRDLRKYSRRAAI